MNPAKAPLSSRETGLDYDVVDLRTKQRQKQCRSFGCPFDKLRVRSG